MLNSKKIFFKKSKSLNFFKYYKFFKKRLTAKLLTKDLSDNTAFFTSKFIYLYTRFNKNIELYHSFMFNVYKKEIYFLIHRLNTKTYIKLINLSKKFKARLR